MKTTCLNWIAAAAFLLFAWSPQASAAPIDNWHIRDAGTLESLNGVAYGNGKFVAVGDGGTILNSPDGVTWSPVASPVTVNLRDVEFGNGLFVAIAGGGPKTMITSPDGVAWTPRPANTGGGYLDATFDGTRFFVIEGNGSFRHSTNGIDWTTGSVGTGGRDPACVIGHNGTWVVAGYETGNTNMGMLYSSLQSLTNWAPRQSMLSENLFGAGYINGLFVVGGQGGALATSPDGVTWTPRNSQTTGFIWDFASNGSYLVAASQWGRMLYSQNGTDWTRVETDLPWHMKAVAYGNGTFVSVGWDGQILQSDPVPGTDGGSAAPTLTIQRKNASQVVVSWPLAATGWTLQRSTNLTTWENEPTAVVATATAHTVTLNCTGAKSFRLRK